MKNASTVWGGVFSLYLFILNFLIKEIIYSIRLVPGSSPGQPIIISIWKSCVYKSEIFNSFIQKKKLKNIENIDR